MQLTLIRTIEKPDFTIGVMKVNGEFMCYTLEDERREVKVPGETRIPEGHYPIKLRKEGGFHLRYTRKFGPAFHHGMLHVTQVPGFDLVLIHIGNTDRDTAGCILVGKTVDKERGFLGSSTEAYRDLYREVINHLLKGEEVMLHVLRMPATAYVKDLKR